MFVTDQQRADHLGCYGNAQVRAPNIDRIAAEGARFAQSYVANPVCMPNRASIFTGRYPKAHGLRENGIALSPAEMVLPEILRQAGYQTASVGKIHLTSFALTREKADHDWELYESRQYQDEHGALPLPYYGFEQVALTCGHGPWTYGHYKAWLDEEHPGAYELLSRQSAAEPPTGAFQCWKAAIPEELHYNTWVADRTIDFLHDRDHSRPFFIWCSFPDPHHPFSPPKPWCDMYAPSDIEFTPARRPDEIDDLPPYFRDCFEGRLLVGGLHHDCRTIIDEHYREIHALTCGMISMVDANVGRVMDELDNMSLTEDTVVLFLSDHGDLMGDHWLINKGPFLYRGLVRVPTLWRVPGGPSGTVVNDLVSAVDVCPTLLELAGIDAPEGVQGRSYAGALKGEHCKGRESVYIEYDESYISDRLRQIRTHDWSLTFYANSDYGLLFDLKNDPDELHNLWDSPRYQSTKRDLLLELLRQSAQADDWLPPKKVRA